MKKLSKFRQKQALLDQLADELQKLEEDQALKLELAFEEKLKTLMNEHGMSARDTADLVRWIST